MKKAQSLAFEEQRDVNQFINKHHLLREDIIDLRYHWGLGDYYYALTFYADESLRKAVASQERKYQEESKKSRWKVVIALTVIFGVIILYFMLVNLKVI